MFDKATILSKSKYDWSLSIPVVRYVVGISFVLLVSTLLNYPLGYLTTVLALGYLAPGAKPISLKQGFQFIVVLIIINAITFMFSSYFKDYPLVFMPLLCLGTLWLYYTDKLPLMAKLCQQLQVFLMSPWPM